ncbi:TerC/Alx family metal homeostasis membrane protein [Anaerocolumna sedimenticola]|uniref:TerC/Alx family metal homeostasis membrane protein n=1 Tax=Anaerocolumna sedimenticola TaxID=2696063 RepID=A0A6P1TSH9_9FIRM|nr:TerC/Alx family metal homeostasis membrane protein [Anaerocolumna sedimenticola]QHQ63212.1 TerC/Alx family metal homeostasis membrane protein [Anaerocolumna sedimenticola]
MSTSKALVWTAFWIDVALLIDIGIFIFMGREKSLEFLGGYMIEQSLSIDNLFLFILVFSSFGIKLEYQRRVLNYGIAGAFILRLLFIVLGVAIVNMFHWVLYIFGIILIISGIKMMQKQKEDVELKNSKILKIMSKELPITKELEGDKFFVRKNKILYATPLFAILILIEFTDIIFAVDSIPAIFSVTTDTFIVYTSNILAILGLRNIYFVLGKLHEKFIYVRYGVAAILTFTGIKLTVLMFDIEISTGWSLAVIFTILAGSLAASVVYIIQNS